MPMPNAIVHTITLEEGEDYLQVFKEVKCGVILDILLLYP